MTGAWRPVVATSGDIRPLLASHGGDTRASAVDQRLLVPVLAQALGALKGGGGAIQAFEALTGQPSPAALEVKPTPEFADRVFAQISAALRAGRPIVAASARNGAALRGRLADAVETGLLDERASRLALSPDRAAPALPLPDGRHDTLFDAKRVAIGDEEADRLVQSGELVAGDLETLGQNRFARYLYLRNPAAAYVPKGSAGLDSGLFRVPLSKFAVRYERVLIGGRPKGGPRAEMARQALR